MVIDLPRRGSLAVDLKITHFILRDVEKFELLLQ